MANYWLYAYDMKSKELGLGSDYARRVRGAKTIVKVNNAAALFIESIKLLAAIKPIPDEFKIIAWRDNLPMPTQVKTYIGHTAKYWSKHIK